LPLSSNWIIRDCIWHSTEFCNGLDCVNRACIESLMAREKFGISERKVQIIAMMGS